ncbi:ATP-binding protein [Fulvivirga kasyanovii]|uniref:ATP-binding protein n=1 Tax=Fulvivirga kasyanovii TaxID=396812 RepID=UPI001625BEDF|nr:ATP-binding protein [Fulvivirga kasyanovii]
MTNILHNSDYDTAKVFALKWLAWEYYFAGSDSTDYFLDRMVDLSKDLNYTKGLWDAYNIKGVVYYTDAAYDSATITFNKAFALSTDDKYSKEKIYSLKYSGESLKRSAKFKAADSCFKRIVEVAKTSNDSTSIAKGYKAVAQNHYAQGDFRAALKYHFKADTFMVNDITIDHAENFQNIAHVYNALDNPKAEMRYYKEALKIYEKMDDKYGINAIYKSLGAMENANKNHNQAREYLEKSYSYFKDYNDPLMLAGIEYQLGLSHHSLGNTDQALVYYNQAASRVEGTEGSSLPANLYRDMGRLFGSRNEPDKSILYFKKALDNALRVGNIQSIELALEALSDAYFAKGDYREAYNTLKRHGFYNDSINVIYRDKALHELEAKYQTEKNEKQIDLLTAQNELAQNEKKTQLYILLGIVLIVLVIAVVFYVLYRNRQKLTKKLRQLDSARSHFFANISHEFRTPLTLIKSPVEKQLAQPGLSVEMQTDLKVINQNADRLLALVDQLLDLSKLESGHLQLRVAHADLFSDIRAMASAFRYLAEQKSIGYTLLIDDTTNLYWYDRDVVEKITVNLLSNAIKYTGESGEVKLTATVAGNRFKLSVKNTGEGIPKEEIDRIFERFYQTDDSHEGVGIGLALVHELTTLHKGHLNYSGEESGWLEFVVTLPVDRASFSTGEFATPERIKAVTGSRATINSHPYSSPVNDQHPDEQSENDATHPTLLIVDDNTDIRKLVKGLFDTDYKVLEAENGRLGIEIALQTIPDVIISDIMMPGVDGVELAATLKQDERTSHIPIILLTAKAGEANELIGLETGADDYVVKPFGNELLKVKVKNLVNIRAQLHKRYSRELVLSPKEVTVTSTDEKFLQRVQALFDEKLTDPQFNAQVFSTEIGMSRMQLHRKLKALVGCTTSELIRSQRLKLAAQLLQKGGVNMSEVGYTVGFNDPSYFSKCFKEFYGHSPSEYAESHSTG